jgi:hypothetical protein
MRYIDYDLLTGKILGDYDYAITAPVGVLLEADIPFMEAFGYYVENGVLVKIPPYPNQYSVFDYTTKQWVDTRTNDTQWALVRDERNQKLQASDWTQMPDVTIPNKTEWATYRQALRDVTNQPDPFSIVWPTPPQ